MIDDKNPTVFKGLNEQGEKIEKINNKLETMDINDLRALAKRNWSYGDYESAQKYYNQISMLDPLDWEAPFYASFVNYISIPLNDVERVLSKFNKMILATVEYIDNSDKVVDKAKSIKQVLYELLEQLEFVKKLFFENLVKDYNMSKKLKALCDCYLTAYRLASRVSPNEKVNIATSLVSIINHYLWQKIRIDATQEELDEIISSSREKLQALNNIDNKEKTIIVNEANALADEIFSKGEKYAEVYYTSRKKLIDMFCIGAIALLIIIAKLKFCVAIANIQRKYHSDIRNMPLSMI